MRNKSLLTNLIALIVTVAAWFIPPGPYYLHEILFSMGLFALSGSLTNWIAIHMLFEKVPGLYGSGIIPNRFESFKTGIRNLIMNNFFTEENFEKFASGNFIKGLNVDRILDKVDFNALFDELKAVITGSRVGAVLGVLGGNSALESFRQPFEKQVKERIRVLVSSPDFSARLLEGARDFSHLREEVETIVEKRLAELTPQMVKEMIQRMIKKHLGWLVIWGGVFGGVIGAISAVLRILDKVGV